MIKSIHIENYKCFQDFTMEDIGPFTVLVGPNDSGKTAFLEAIRLLGALPPGHGQLADQLEKKCGLALGQEVAWRQEDVPIKVSGVIAKCAGEETGIVFRCTSSDRNLWKYDVAENGQTVPASEQLEVFNNFLKSPPFYRFAPGALRDPSPLYAGMDETGDGFAAFLDKLNRFNPSGGRQLESEFCHRFPHYSSVVIDIRPTTVHVKADHTYRRTDCFILSFRTAHSKLLPVTSVSDGVMLSLAFMALRHAPEPPKVLLIEEPENGVHPGSLKEIVKTLRELSEKGTQIILTTHSPYLVDEVQPEEVRVFAKDEEGAVHAKRLSEYPDVEEMKKHLMTGEIWSALNEAHGI